jgi:hypothetical protein
VIFIGSTKNPSFAIGFGGRARCQRRFKYQESKKHQEKIIKKAPKPPKDNHLGGFVFYLKYALSSEAYGEGGASWFFLK